MRTAIVFALLVMTASISHSNPALQSLVDAERAFSAMSVERGMRDAFIENLAVDGVVFQPLPVNGRSVWEPRPKSPATLIWEPAFAEIAAAGDLGYTTGPWELRPPEDAKDRPVLHGHFISVWRRAAGGPWKVVVDLGSTHEKSEPGVGSGAFTAGPVHAAARGADRSRAAAREIASLEKRFSSEASRLGFAAAFGARATSDVRWNRDGSAPALGGEAARAAAAADAARSRWKPHAWGASASADLGYAFGVRERLGEGGGVADSAAFLHLWRREAGAWRLALVVDNPIVRR